MRVQSISMSIDLTQERVTYLLVLSTWGIIPQVDKTF